MNEPLVLTDLERSFKTGDRDLHILRGVDLVLHAGEIVGLVGPSGAGKSSLLHAAGLLERPNAGRVLVQGIDGWGLNERARTDLRRDSLGFVYQFHHLLPEFSALENVAMPVLIAGNTPGKARERAGELLDLVGLAERIGHRPAQLSGGEQQRVAIARALANRPSVLLADEPTGNLDPRTAHEVFEALRRIVHEQNVSALIATHNLDVARGCDRVLTLSDGLLAPRA
jgi:lipoprotein-releasing system ATP-binding protein